MVWYIFWPNVIEFWCYSLYRYIVNFVDVMPDRDRLSVFKISKTLKDFGFTRIVHVVNRYSQTLLSTSLSSEYGDLEPGVYIAYIGREANKDVLRNELQYAFAKYFEELSQSSFTQKYTQPSSSSSNVNEFVDSLVNSAVEEVIPSTSYVIANLLNNLMEKIIPIHYRCHEKGARVCIKLDVETLREILQRDEELSKEPLFNFCEEYPSLCGDDNNGCAKFFRVIKEFHIRFQHSVIDDKERIYMIFFSQYRRLGGLELRKVIDFLKSYTKLPVKDINIALEGVRVNVTLPDGSVLCEIKDMKSEEDCDVVELECISKEPKEPKALEIHYNELDEYDVRINPTYKSSREFISNYLCKYFDEHKKLSWFTPSEYFKILENDLKIFKKLLAKFALTNIVLGGVTYTIKDNFVKVPDIWA
jgi:hypothetical protein